MPLLGASYDQVEASTQCSFASDEASQLAGQPVSQPKLPNHPASWRGATAKRKATYAGYTAAASGLACVFGARS